MTFKKALFLTCAAALAACTPGPNIKDGQYWQRSSASEAIYAQGPKAQQMLDRDIGRCVVELRELESLHVIKDAIPTDSTGMILDPDPQKMEDWDTPDHDAHLLAEHTDYHDFEGCMKAKGWERIKYVPFDVAARARQNYFKARIDYGYDPAEKNAERQAPQKSETVTHENDFSELNN